jgi:hypothetical protein
MLFMHLVIAPTTDSTPAGHSEREKRNKNGAKPDRGTRTRIKRHADRLFKKSKTWDKLQCRQGRRSLSQRGHSSSLSLPPPLSFSISDSPCCIGCITNVYLDIAVIVT